MCATSFSANAECVENVDFFEEVPVEAIAPAQETVASEAVEVDTIEVDDFQYVEAVHRRTANYDYRSVEVGGKRVLLESAPNSGLEIGVQAGVDYFNSMVTPTVGAELGYHGKRFSFAASANVGMSQYNSESAKAGEKYLTTNFNLEAGVKFLIFLAVTSTRRKYGLSVISVIRFVRTITLLLMMRTRVLLTSKLRVPP